MHKNGLRMKTKALLILVVFVIAAALPVSIELLSPEGSSHIRALDVCDAPGNAVSVNAPMPAIHTRPCSLTLPEFESSYESRDSVPDPFVMSFALHRPPKI
jgi:hypothetical protein